MNINPDLLLKNQPTTTQQTGNSTLGKEDFLKLLLTQLKTQDPMDPMKNSDYISQMANFTSLEQTQNMSDVLSQFVATQKDNSIAQYSTMIGKTISWQSSDSGSQTTLTSTVTGVAKQNDSIKILTSDGHQVAPASITKLSEDAADTQTD